MPRQISARRTMARLLSISSLFLLLALQTAGATSASEEVTDSAWKGDHKVGYTRKPVFGGPNSPEGQIEDNDQVKYPIIRWPWAYEAAAPWRERKALLNEQHNFQLSGHYATLY